MQSSITPPYPNRISSTLKNYEKGAPQAANLPQKKENVSWGAIVLVGLYFFYLWQPPILKVPNYRWYILLVMATFAFLMQRRFLNLKASRTFWIVYGLNILGAALSLLRAQNFDLSAQNTIALVVSFTTYMLFIPVLATRTARRVLIILLLAAAMLWAIEIQRLLQIHTALIYTNFAETGDDKNHIGFLLSLASVVLLYLGLQWKPSKAMPRWQERLIRAGCIAVSIFFFYSLTLIYARSGILTTIVGISAVLFVVVLQSPKKFAGLAQVIVFSVFLIGVVVLLLPQILSASPQWKQMYTNFQSQGINMFADRTILLQKGWFLVAENPFIGVGAGGSRAAISTPFDQYPGYLIHNSYLTDWAEKGILGLLSNVAWIGMYLQLFRKRFLKLPFWDQVWILLLIPLFFNMNFLDMSSISYTMLAIMVGISYEKYLVDHSPMK